MQRVILLCCHQLNICMRVLLFFLMTATIFSSCNHNDAPVNDVWVRIENNAGVSLENTTIGAVTYGDIVAGSTTGYKELTEPIYAGYCNFKLNGQTMFAGFGVCGSPLPPPLAPGHYNFKVNAAPPGYFTLEVSKR